VRRIHREAAGGADREYRDAKLTDSLTVAAL
jgi:hypothetical protein